MNIEELKKCALQWAEENEGNRAVMLITIERGETDEATTALKLRRL